jgi:hypothetical protein
VLAALVIAPGVLAQPALAGERGARPARLCPQDAPPGVRLPRGSATGRRQDSAPPRARRAGTAAQRRPRPMSAGLEASGVGRGVALQVERDGRAITVTVTPADMGRGRRRTGRPFTPMMMSPSSPLDESTPCRPAWAAGEPGRHRLRDSRRRGQPRGAEPDPHRPYPEPGHRHRGGERPHDDVAELPARRIDALQAGLGGGRARQHPHYHDGSASTRRFSRPRAPAPASASRFPSTWSTAWCRT